MNGGDWVEIVGGLAAVLSTASFAPQAWRLIVRKDAKAISLTMYLMFAGGVALWLVYGIAHGSWPIIAANAITLALALAIVGAKLRYG